MGSRPDLNKKMKKVLVTGGGGFVGKGVVRLCVEQGIETIIVGRNRYPNMEKLGARCVVGNICDHGVIDRALHDVDCVFHVAALAGIWGTWQEYYQTNVLGTENILRSCLKNKVRALVYTSTPSVVFNRQDICGANEDLPYATAPLCNYAKSKIMAEKLVLSANSEALSTCALRPHLIWGPEDPHLLPRLVESGRKKDLKQVGGGSNLVDISYVDNVAHAHVLAAINLFNSGSAAGKPYFISQGEPVNLWNWIAELYKQLGIEEITASVSFPVAYRLGGVLELLYGLMRSKKEPKMTRFLAEQLAKSHYFSIDNAIKELGYQPLVSTEEGLVKTIQWLETC